MCCIHHKSIREVLRIEYYGCCSFGLWMEIKDGAKILYLTGDPDHVRTMARLRLQNIPPALRKKERFGLALRLLL